MRYYSMSTLKKENVIVVSIWKQRQLKLLYKRNLKCRNSTNKDKPLGIKKKDEMSNILSICIIYTIITDPHKIILFSLGIKSTIAVFKMPKQLPEENGGGPFCQQGNYQG